MHKHSFNISNKFVKDSFLKSAKSGDYTDEVLITVIRVLSDYLAKRDLKNIITIHEHIKPKVNQYWDNIFKKERDQKRQRLEDLNRKQMNREN